MPIPAKLHYVWVGPKPLPVRDRAFINAWRQLNPDFVIKRWTEQDIDLEKYPIVATAMRRGRYALAADVIRMYAVFKEGGIYLDTDVELLKPLKPLLKFDAFAGWESSFWFTTAVFGASRHHPWVGKILHRYALSDPNRRITTNTFLKTVHSPSVYAAGFYDLKLNGQTQLFNGHEFAVFAPEYFSPKHYLTGVVHKTERTIAFHHYASTWHTRSEALKNEVSLLAYRKLGEKYYELLEKKFHEHIAKQILQELP